METNVNFSKNQKEKIKSAFKKKIPVSIHYKVDQLKRRHSYCKKYFELVG